MLRHVESLEFFISCTFTGIDQISDAFLLLLVVVTATIKRNKLLNSQESATNSNDNRLSLDLHEDLLSGESIDTWSFSFEMHFAAQSQRCFIDVVGQILINRIVLLWLIDEKFVFNTALYILHLLLETLDLLIFLLTTF